MFTITMKFVISIFIFTPNLISNFKIQFNFSHSRMTSSCLILVSQENCIVPMTTIIQKTMTYIPCHLKLVLFATWLLKWQTGKNIITKLMSTLLVSFLMLLCAVMKEYCTLFLTLIQTALYFDEGLILWQLCHLETPYEEYTFQNFRENVFEKGIRPKISKKDLSQSLRLADLQTRSWANSMSERPEFSEIREMLRDEIFKLDTSMRESDLDFSNKTEKSIAQED